VARAGPSAPTSAQCRRTVKEDEMAKGRTGSSAEPFERPALTKPRDEVERLLQAQLERGRAIRDTPIPSWEALKEARALRSTWADYVEELLRSIFTTSRLADEFSGRGHMAFGAFGGQPDLRQDTEEFRSGVASYVRRLESIIERLPLFDGPGSPASGSPRTETQAELNRRVFVVHGHSREPVEAVARLLSDQGLEAVILNEQPNRGRTIIEKFEGHADVGYAVVIMSADDHGGEAGKPTVPRARQNVILELGFFIGTLGRRRVAALVEESVERPSDIDGVLYIPLDPGRAWRFQLGKELRDAGLPIDLNLI
jgi:hypothetical protein